MDDEGTVEDRDEGLRDSVCKGPESGAAAADEDDCAEVPSLEAVRRHQY
jgi:hypothetical protein